MELGIKTGNSGVIGLFMMFKVVRKHFYYCQKLI